MSHPALRRTVTITLENATWRAVELNIEAQRRAIDGKPMRACDLAPLLDTLTVLELIKREIIR